MADQLSSTTAKKTKKKGMVNLFRDLIKRPKPANSSASQSSQVSVSPAFGDNDPAPGYNAGSVELIGSSKDIDSILVLSRSSELSLLSRSYHSLSVGNTSIYRSRSGFCRGSRWVVIRLIFTFERRGQPENHYAGPDFQTQNSQEQVSDWKEITKDRIGVASRFVQTLLKKVPGCVDTNPVKVAFSIAKVIIEIKNVGCCLYILGTGWLYQAVGDNKDELAQRLEETANRLLAVERTVVRGVPKTAEGAMEKLKSYVVF